MMEEIQSIMQGKTALPLSDRQQLVFTGEDRARYLNGQTTNDVVKLEAGHAMHAAVCNAKGKMQGDIMIAHQGDRLLVDLPLSLADTLPLRLEKYIIADDVEILGPEIEASDVTGFHLLGDTAPELAKETECYASSRFNQPGHDIWLPQATTPPFPVATAAAAEWIRIQTGTPQWGVDIDENNLPPEAFSEHQTISYRKGCYIGQETIARIKSIGRVNKQLCLLQGTSPLEALPLDATSGEKTVGRITSCQSEPDFTGAIHALGIIQAIHSEPETELVVAGSSWRVIQTFGG